MTNRMISILMGIALAGFLFALPSCACWTDQAKMSTVGCIVAHDVVDCTASAAQASLPYFVNIIGGLISGGIDPNNIPWTNIEKQAESMGIKDGGCFLAELKNQFFGPTLDEPMNMAMGSPMASVQVSAIRQKASDLLLVYKLKHFGASVRFRIKDAATGKVVEL